jgi:hypothetical protein
MAAVPIVIHPGQPPRLVSIEGLPVRDDVASTDAEGRENKGVRRETEKAIKNLSDVLRCLLGPEEEVLYVARSEVRPRGLGWLVAGAYMRYYSRLAMVFTNHRLLYLFVNRWGGWWGSVRAVRWGDVQDARIKGWIRKTLVVSYRSGASDSFWRLRGRDARTIRLLVSIVLTVAAGGSTPAQEAVSLCPKCLRVLSPRLYRCEACGTPFKDEASLWWWTALIPGGGFFYTDQMFHGALQSIAEVYLIVLVGLLLTRAASSATTVASGAARSSTVNSTVDLLVAAVFVAGLLVLQKWATLYHCRRVVRRFIPQKGELPP